MTIEHAMDSMFPSEFPSELGQSNLGQAGAEQSHSHQHIAEPDVTSSEVATEVTEEINDAKPIVNGDLWKIIVHNDEVTPYDFVIQILEDLFMLSEELADHVAWTAHNKGVAVVVVRPRAEAEKLVKVAHGRARMGSYPLTFSLEQD